MIKKLRTRFVIINMAIITGMLLVIFGLVIHFTNQDLDNKSDTMLQQLAQSALDPSNPQVDIPLPYFALTFNTRGEVRASGKTNLDITNPQFLDGLMRRIANINRTTGYIAEYNLKYTVVTSPTLQVVAFLDVSNQRSALISLVQNSMIIAAVALAGFAVISILLARWTVKPVEKAWNQQKQFLSDASHELKTPLTVIMSNAELLHSAEDADENQLQYSGNILSSSGQMRHLIEGMLELARADNGQLQTNFESVNLSKLVSDAVLPFEPVFFEQDMILQSGITPDIQVKGSPQHLRQLTDILLDNAQKYSAPGIVALHLTRQEQNQCLLSVSNPGNPIPEAELSSIFQRFYRTDTARTGGSFGLGLSIAKRITEEHSGKIWAESNETGNCFFVLLPCLE